MKPKGVITGDIIESSKIRSKSRDELLASIQEISNDLKHLSIIKTEIYRGDSFQIFVENPTQVLKVAVLLRAKLRGNKNEKWDARLAIGIGEVDYIAKKILMSDGDAYNYSGWEFDELAKRKLAIRTPWEDINKELKVSTAFADNIISKWTSGQAQTIYMSLSKSLQQKQIAEEMGKNPQNISQILINANESLIKNYLERYEQIMKTKE